MLPGSLCFYSEELAPKLRSDLKDFVYNGD